MNAKELKQKIVDTYDLQPGQVFVDYDEPGWMVRLCYENSNALWIFSKRTAAPFSIAERQFADMTRMQETIDMLKIAQSIIESGELDK